MAFRLIQADQRIIDSVQFVMEGPPPVDGFFGGGKIPIQFPPRIKTKTKTGNYQLMDNKGFYEPVAVWRGATGTQITVEFKYVVTGGPWDITKISNAVHDIMGYFYRNVAVQIQETFLPLIKVIMYKIVPKAGNETSRWRVENATVNYSDELIFDDGDIYPQVTTVTLTMVMVTRIVAKSEKAKQKLKAPDKALKEWY
jgi:hypothetical protein